MFDKKDFQNYLDRPPAYWEDFGRRSAGGLHQLGVSLNSEQLERTITNALLRLNQETGATLGDAQAVAFAKGMREGYSQPRP